jgi:hypothetical protein
MRFALGFRAHSGWAAMVAAAGTLEEPRVLDRRRIVIADPEMKQPYHAAAELPLAEAEAIVANAIASSRQLAIDAIAAAVDALQRKGHEVAACGILTGSGRALPNLEGILASHALIHTAEGELFRDVLIQAARECGLAVATLREKTVPVDALKTIATLGKLIGPPWTQDQKYATIAALSALAAGAVE